MKTELEIDEDKEDVEKLIEQYAPSKD